MGHCKSQVTAPLTSRCNAILNARKAIAVKPRQTGMLYAQGPPKPNPDSCAERKPFRIADFFSGLLS